MYDYLIVGAGLAGCVLAERLATQRNSKVLIVEKRSHVGGNAYDYRDTDGILLHAYGPHLFHTNDALVFQYLSQFTEWRFYQHKVLANVRGFLYPMPINRNTLIRFLRKTMFSDNDALQYLSKVQLKFPFLHNSEERVLSQVGRTLYHAFYENYTRKQWMQEAHTLDSGVCGRIPVRIDVDARYFNDTYQVVPKLGYTHMFNRLLEHRNIELALSTNYRSLDQAIRFNKVIYTGPIDEYFDYIHGRLPYRSVIFDHQTYNQEFVQPVAQINHCDNAVPYTRVSEWKHITGQMHEKTVLTYEYATVLGEQYYPIPTSENHTLYTLYKKDANKLRSVYFVGRLAEYRYYNMDQVVARALNLYESIISKEV